MARELAYFENVAGTSRCYIDDVNNGYKSTLTLPFDYADRTDSNVGIFDAGISYDYIETEMMLYMTAERIDQLISFFHAHMRTESVVFKAPESWGMYAFGPMFAVDKEFTVVITNFQSLGQIDSPYLYHALKVSMVLSDMTSILSPATPSCVEPGTISIAEVSNIRFPQGMFKPDDTYEYYTSTTLGGEVYQVTRSSAADKKYTSFELYTGNAVGGQLIYKLMAITRANPFIMQVPKNSYPFGYEAGDNAGFLCKLISNNITMQHEEYQDWRIGLSLIKVS